VTARHQPATPAPPPAVQRLVIRYAKRGRMRFASHRDIARAVERGVRRASLPVAFSAGFSPHPKISYHGGAPTGAASEAEYLEIALTAIVDPEDVRVRLDEALPEGIDVIEVSDMAVATNATQLEASVWQVVLPGVHRRDAASAVQAFLASPTVEVERRTSKGVRRLDARAAVVSLEVDQHASAGEHTGCAILRMVVRHLTPAVRPNDILVALRHLSALEPSSAEILTRLAQGPLGGTAAAGASAPGPDMTAEQFGQSGLSAPAGPATEASRPGRRGAALRQVKATCLDANDASLAYAAPASAYEQLSRGAERPEEVACAREPDGRDCPNARERATEQRVP